MKIKIDFVITCLGAGGAQKMLLKLLSQIDRDTFLPRVISMSEDGRITSDLTLQFQALEIPVVRFDMPRSLLGAAGIFRLAQEIRRRNPALVSTWLYHADLIGGLAARMAGIRPIVWNIRNSTLESGSSKTSTIMTVQACARLSRLIPAQIICCAESSRKIHIDMGYDAKKMIVIPNGFNLDTFLPSAESRRRLRYKLGIPDHAFVVGTVSRFDPQKDHRNFIAAAAKLKIEHRDAHFILCGDRISWSNHELAGWIKDAGLVECTHLLGYREDIPAIVNSFDIATSSSRYGEAFPNIIGEAMACAIPCVVTDVGDSAFIVGTTGKVVAAGDPEALNRAWTELADMPVETRSALGQSARKRVLEKFSLNTVTTTYESLFLGNIESP